MKTFCVRIALIFLAICFFPDFPLAAAARGGMRQVSCIVHIQSSFSGKSTESFSDILKQSRALGIDAVVFNEKDMMRWEYGLWPFRNIMKRTVQDNSVLLLGPARYLGAMKNASRDFPDMVVIPGVESAPFYCWKGNPLAGNLQLLGWHKHMLVIGMEKPEDYENLPLVSNPKAGAFNLLMFWPLAVIAGGMILRKRRTLAALLVFTGTLLLINNYPFRYFEFSQYSHGYGEKPYQKLIDYVDKKGGLTFWAHPEAVNWETPRRFGSITVSTQRYPQSILDTVGCTGFAIFSQGWREAGKPGGYWDQALAEYCGGFREKPVWAIGEIDYDANSYPLNQIQNILWVKEKTKEAVLQSLKNGNYYVTWRNMKWGFKLSGFSLSSGRNKAVCGEEIKYAGPVRARMVITATDSQKHKTTVRIIRNGKVDKLIIAQTPVEIVYEDSEKLPDQMNFYRFMIEGGYPILATNPVFVKR
ncbi:MAG: hypothetical protein ABII64_01490 [Elusimicrobiota bacterium]